MKRALAWAGYGGIAVLVAAALLPFVGRPEWFAARWWLVGTGVVLVALSLLGHVDDLKGAFAHRTARYGLNIADVQSVVSAAIGGETIGETIEGRSRFPINVRYPRELRDSVDKLRNLPVVTERGAQIPLSTVATVQISDGPPMLRSENARLSGWIYVDIRGRDLGSVVADAKRAVAEQVKLPPGVSLATVWKLPVMSVSTLATSTPVVAGIRKATGKSSVIRSVKSEVGRGVS